MKILLTVNPVIIKYIQNCGFIACTRSSRWLGRYLFYLLVFASLVIFMLIDINKVFSINHLKLKKYETIEKTRQHLLRQYNLLDRNENLNDDCSIEHMNANKLEQDHPCVIKIIRQFYLRKPPPAHVPLRLDNPDWMDSSAGQVTAILKHLEHREWGGFFVEAGAYDGEFLSNTLFMERYLKWSGILIEANQKIFQKLLLRQRKSFALPVCLSAHPYPTQVQFKMLWVLGSIQENGKSKNNITEQMQVSMNNSGEIVQAQCFPLYSILLAVNQTKVDFLSLDVEGSELDVLNTIPWHKVDIQTMAVEWDHVGKEPLVQMMTKNGFHVFGEIDVVGGKDLYFTKNL